MVVLGGVTRLTGSGLSMVHWEPLSGVIPPVNDTEWLEEFDHYRATPEYAKVNRGMSVAEFKKIFYFDFNQIDSALNRYEYILRLCDDVTRAVDSMMTALVSGNIK